MRLIIGKGISMKKAITILLHIYLLHATIVQYHQLLLLIQYDTIQYNTTFFIKVTCAYSTQPTKGLQVTNGNSKTTIRTKMSTQATKSYKESV